MFQFSKRAAQTLSENTISRPLTALLVFVVCVFTLRASFYDRLYKPRWKRLAIPIART